MKSFILTAWLLSLACSALTEKVETIHKDVAIIGGGASGSYSAVRLREDFGVSVVIIEKDEMLVSLP